MKVLTSNTKMADLIEANYHLLSVLVRLGIEGAFGERTVGELCEKHHLDTTTFILICNIYSYKDFRPSEEVLRKGSVEDIIRYLHQSHDYYLNSALVAIAGNMETLIQPCTQAQKQVIWKFFSDYKTELDKHFAYEEEEVIPYVKGLLRGKRMPGFSIDKFEENHSSINETLLDLKSLILKSLPPFCDDTLRVRLLNYLFALQKDLKCHTRIEDEVLVPMVRLIEDPSAKVIPESLETEKGNEDSDSNSADILSEREKEILVSVAQGLLNKEIADRHNISINTVITHRKNITRKTGIKTVAGLTVYAILNNLLDINDIPQQ
jgi:regulator of cell morphogenesis and NO signaling